MGALSATDAIIAALALLWIAIAIAVSYLALRRFQIAQQVLDIARANATLLEISPARPMLVRSDGRIEANRAQPRTRARLRAQKSFRLHGPDFGLLSEDVTALRSQIEAASASASRIEAKVRSSRILADLRRSRRSGAIA